MASTAISGDGFGPYGVNQYGNMNFDQRHVVKFNGTYFFPYGINAGATYTYTDYTYADETDLLFNL